MQEIKFVENKHLKEKPKDQSKLGFGRIFTDYMFTMEYNSKEGWHNAQVRPYENLSFDPATTFIHYGQAFFAPRITSPAQPARPSACACPRWTRNWRWRV